MLQILTQKISFWKRYTYKRECDIEQIDLSNSKNVSIKYFITSHSSSHFKDHENYLKFRDKYEVVSGGWYGSEGRWKTLKKINREICFSNFKRLIKTTQATENYYQITKPKFSNTCRIEISIINNGTYSFTCDNVVFTEYYKLFLYNISLDDFEDMTSKFEGMNFVGNL